MTRKVIFPIHIKIEMNYVLNIKEHKRIKEEPTKPFYWFCQLLSWHLVPHNHASTQVRLSSLASRNFKSECHSSHQQTFDKVEKGLELRCIYFSAIQTSISTFYVNWCIRLSIGDSHSFRIKSLYTFICEKSINLKIVIQPLRETESFY
jgi:hypothetical protein